MILLHNIGDRANSNYNTREEILACKEPLTFDGVYKNVWENRDILKGKDFILFVTGDYIGKDNSFDAPMRREMFCDWNQIMDLVVGLGGKLGWHTWSHKDLTLLPREEIVKEVTPPFPMDYFAYPYGKFNEEVLAAVVGAGFREAFSVFQGNNSQYQRLRKYLNW